jgi:hypothetical protein
LRFRTPVHLVLQSTNASPFALPPFIWLYALPTPLQYAFINTDFVAIATRFLNMKV